MILHICGKTVDRMDYIAQTGLAAFHYDSKNDPAESMEIVTDRIALIGNINNPETLFARGPEQVAEEVVRNLDAGVPLVGPECAIPLQTRSRISRRFRWPLNAGMPIRPRPIQKRRGRANHERISGEDFQRCVVDL